MESQKVCRINETQVAGMAGEAVAPVSLWNPTGICLRHRDLSRGSGS
jgi:hypothetical protein